VKIARLRRIGLQMSSWNNKREYPHEQCCIHEKRLKKVIACMNIDLDTRLFMKSRKYVGELKGK